MKTTTVILLFLVVLGWLVWKYWPKISSLLTTTTPATAGARSSWFKDNIWTIVLIVVGIALLWWSYDTKMAQLGSWGKNQPLFLLMLWGILASLIALYTGALGKATPVLQWVVAGGVLFALFLGSPVGEFFTKDEKVTEKQVLTLSPNGESVHLPSAPGHHFEFTGAGFKAFVVYRDGTVCSEKCPNGPILEVFVRDTTGKKNSVSYELVRS